MLPYLIIVSYYAYLSFISRSENSTVMVHIKHCQCGTFFLGSSIVTPFFSSNFPSIHDIIKRDTEMWKFTSQYWWPWHHRIFNFSTFKRFPFVIFINYTCPTSFKSSFWKLKSISITSLHIFELYLLVSVPINERPYERALTLGSTLFLKNSA